MPNNNQNERNSYDLSHWSHTCGSIGCLQTLSVIPVVAGDTFNIDLASVFRLSPLRRNLAADAVVDLFAFFVPHRHIYTNWVDFMKEGYDEAQTLGTRSISSGYPIACVGQYLPESTTAPKWIIDGYLNIFNRYFKHPSDTDKIYSDLLSSAEYERLYGLACCYQKAIWNTGVTQSQITSADTQYTVSGSVVELQDFALQMARLESEAQRDYFGVRYADLIQKVYGGNPTTDADPRPTLLMRNTSWLSGYDVDGTDASGLGISTSKATGNFNLQIPHRFFDEHGTIWIMALVRFPSIVTTERHYLVSKPEPTYAQIAGDPSIISKSKPVDVVSSDFFHDGVSTVLNKIPHSQWYRYQPNYVHNNFKTVTGHPFINTPGSTWSAYYAASDFYDACFQSLQMKHWQAFCHISVDALRVIPDPRSSIFAGTNLS